MTAYVTDRTPAVFWADTEAEMWELAIAAGIDLTAHVNAGSFQFFNCSPDDRLRLVRAGAQDVDWLEPAFQKAEREGDYSMMATFSEYRAKWSRLGKPVPRTAAEAMA